MGRNSFNAQGDAVVARAFRYAGVEYDVGEPFPWRELGGSAERPAPMTEHDLRGLWLSDLIDFVDPEVARRARNDVKVRRKAKAEGTESATD